MLNLVLAFFMDSLMCLEKVYMVLKVTPSSLGVLSNLTVDFSRENKDISFCEEIYKFVYINVNTMAHCSRAVSEE